MLFFDIETDGLLDEMTTIHCINIYDGSTNQHERYDPATMPVALGVKRLQDADELCGHNIIGFDIPAIQKIHPAFKPKGRITDTLVLAKLCFPLIKKSDFGRTQKGQLPSDLIGKHKLEAWGYRLGVLKGDVAKQTDWQKWTPAMSDYCEQDVVVTLRLYEAIQNQKPADKAVELELTVDAIIQKQQHNGIGFNKNQANELLAELMIKREENLDIIYKSFHPFYKKSGKTFIPKRDNKRLGYVAGAACSKISLVDFNPTSAQHVYVWLRRKYGWEPTEFTKKSKIPEQFRYLFSNYYKQLGQDTWLEPKISDEILEGLQEEYPEAEPIGKVMTLSKRIAQLDFGNQAWLKHVGDDGIIHGACNPLGTRTRRATHFSPNLAQVPAVYSPYGKECRALFHPVTPGWVQVGADASGVEARVLSHYTYPFDGGAFTKLILEGDLHQVNADVLRLTRDDAKTFFYAFLYGAGNKKLGNIAKRDIAYGKKMRAALLKKQVGLGKLVTAVGSIINSRGYLLALDGQRLPSVSEHSALNTLCQCAGSLVVKKAMLIYTKEAQRQGCRYNQMLWVHDEFQCECHPDDADVLGQTMVDSFRLAGEYYNLNITLDGEYKVGKNWEETH